MPRFSPTSKRRLLTCHPDLIRLFDEVVKSYNCSIICGHRSKEEQMRVHESGHSQLQWPMSKHNRAPSMAVDVMPYPIDWHDLDLVKSFAAQVLRIAGELGIEVAWGGHWEHFKDYPHYELKE